LYHEYIGEITAAAVLDVQGKSIELLKTNNIQRIPIIIILKNIDKTNFKLPIGDYAKAISGFDLVKHVSGAWIVGASDEVKKIIGVINKFFFAGRMHFASTLQEAQVAAHQFAATSESILE